MARLARVVVPGFPYHVTHRGNRREAIFFDDEDRKVYLAMMQDYAHRYGLQLWACCLMTNHVHFVVVPQSEESKAMAVGRAHALRALAESQAGLERAPLQIRGQVTELINK